MSETKQIAAIRIRGEARVNKDINNTLDRLRLRNKHNCVILNSTPDIVGMLMKCKDYITWGEVEADIIKELETKRGEKDTEGKLKKVFRLSPPVGGFEKKGIKKPFTTGGVLGNRREMITELIKKML